jgi:hypothetical protein
MDMWFGCGKTRNSCKIWWSSVLEKCHLKGKRKWEICLGWIWRYQLLEKGICVYNHAHICCKFIKFCNCSGMRLGHIYTDFKTVWFCISENIQAKNRVNIIQEDVQPGSKIINVVIYSNNIFCSIVPHLLNYKALNIIWTIGFNMKIVIFMSYSNIFFFSRYESVEWSIW